VVTQGGAELVTEPHRTPRRSRRRPVVVLLALALGPTVAMSALWRWAEDRAALGEPAIAAVTSSDVEPSLVTPLLSVRRAPTALAVSSALEAFRFQLGAVTSVLDTTSCLAVSAHDRLVVGVGSSTPLIPASTMKLLVGTVALEVIGREATFVTEVRGEVVDGVLDGPLHLVGGGDPLLAAAWYPTTQRLAPEPRTPVESLVDAVVGSGVTLSAVGVVVHEERYDTERFVPTWGDGIRSTEAGPVGALLINDGFVTGSPIKPADPALAAGVEVANLLRDAGVDVTGDVIRADATPGLEAPANVIASVTSAPLHEVVAEMLTTSDNTTAEMLVKEIAVAAGRPGTRIDGLSVIQETLDRWGVPLADMTLVDGSGLDRGNRLSCDLVLALLQRPGHLDALRGVMAVAGETGTVAGLLRETPLAGRLLVKTGTLREVKAYSGYLPDAGGVDLVFSLMINGDQSAACSAVSCPILETLARALATYPGGAPTPDALRPRPVDGGS